MLKQSDRLNKSEPTLIVKYGNTSKRFLSLERKSVILGRARGCDIELDAPDISLVHCVITRGPGGLTLRDCGSRAGTKVNGAKVQEAVLHNGDIVLIGTFSFEVYVPWKTEPADVDVAAQQAYKEQVERLEKSRQRLTSLALSMRRRLHQERDGGTVVGTSVAMDMPGPDGPHGQDADSDDTLQDKPFRLEHALAERQAGLNHELEILRERLGDYEQKFLALEQREQALLARQAEFERKEQEQDETSRQLADVQTEQENTGRQQAETQAELDKGRAALTQAQAEFDARRDVAVRELIAYRDHLAQLRRRIEEKARQTAKRDDDMAQTGPLLDEVRRLDLRRRELDCFARHLRRTRVNHQHEHVRWTKAMAELHSLFTEASHYQHVGLQALQQAKDCVDGLRKR